MAIRSSHLLLFQPSFLPPYCEIEWKLHTPLTIQHSTTTTPPPNICIHSLYSILPGQHTIPTPFFIEMNIFFLSHVDDGVFVLIVFGIYIYVYIEKRVVVGSSSSATKWLFFFKFLFIASSYLFQSFYRTNSSLPILFVSFFCKPVKDAVSVLSGQLQYSLNKPSLPIRLSDFHLSPLLST